MVKRYVLLMKPNVIWLLVFASVAGYLVASEGAPDVWRLMALVLVGVLSTGGAAAFNMYYERDVDSVMSRTMKRPLPRGLVSPVAASAYSYALMLLGVLLSYVLLGPVPTLFVLLGMFSYVVVYTVLLKRRHWSNVLLGGFAGNAAFLTGWSLASHIGLEAVLLSFTIYMWIPAHIWSLAIRYSDDYRRASIPMLPVVLNDRESVKVVAMLNIAATAYMWLVYLYLMGVSLMMLLFVVPSIVSVVQSLKAFSNPTPEIFWKMFKASSPVLTLFLTTLILSSALGV